MLLVVRHADAGEEGDGDGPPSLRPLSAAGHRQAAGLVVRLEDYPVDRILCSPTLRAHQTVEPLARDRFLEVETAAALGMGAGATELLCMSWARQLPNTLLCASGETIGRLLAGLVADGLMGEEPMDWPNGSTWLLQSVGGREVRGRLLAPLVLDASDVLIG